MLDLKVYPKVHNRFDVYKKNVETGEEKQVGYAENIVLDQMWTRLCGGSTYFVNIHYGTGTGILSAARKSLFTHLGTAAAVDVAKVKAIPTSSWRRSIVLGLSTANGSNLSELGIAYGTGQTYLVTHAMIRDMNGNVITIPKTDLDIITIYATVYITLDNSDANLKLLHPDVNGLLTYLLGGSFPYAGFSAGESRLATDIPYGLVSQPLGDSATGSWSADVANKRRSTSLIRFGTTQGNGNIGEILASNIARLVLPASGIYAGLDLVGVSVETGNGVDDTFYLPSANARLATVAVKIDGVTSSALTKSASKKAICFLDPATLPTTGTALGCALSTDGSVLAVASASSPYIRTYDLAGGAWVVRAQPATPPTEGAYECALSADGSVLAVAYGSSHYILTYDWTDGAWVARAQPAITPTYALGCALSADGTVLAVTHNSSPYLRTYDWTDGAWVARAQPATPPAGADTVKGCALSADGTVLAVASTSSPYIRTYDLAGGAWVVRAQPATLPAGNAFGCALSADGSVLAVAHDSSPCIRTYDWTGGAWVVRAQPATLPTGTALGCALSTDGSVLAVASALSPYILTYDWTGGAWVVRAQPATLPAGAGRGCALSADGSVLAVTHDSSPRIRIYDWEDINTKIVFNTPPGLVAGEAVGTGNGSEVNFVLDYTPTGGTLTVKLNGSTTTDYTLAGSTITFNTAPGTGVAITADYKYEPVITADYTVDGIHKTSQRVIDCQFTIQFGIPT